MKDKLASIGEDQEIQEEDYDSWSNAQCNWNEDPEFFYNSDSGVPVFKIITN